MFAVVKTGGKQYKVQQNDVLKIERIEGNAGDKVDLSDIIAIGDDSKIEVGSPIQGAKVVAEIIEQKRDDKVLIFKKRRRKHSRSKQGHRQDITIVRILDLFDKSGKKIASEKKAAKPAAEKKEANKA